MLHTRTHAKHQWRQNLNSTVFQKAMDEAHFQPDVDLFASQLNYKCKRYVSYHPDPGSYAINAFYINLAKVLNLDKVFIITISTCNQRL